jgi:hypothetical protein
MRRSVLCERIAVRYAFIRNYQAQFAVAVQATSCLEERLLPLAGSSAKYTRTDSCPSALMHSARSSRESRSLWRPQDLAGASRAGRVAVNRDPKNNGDRKRKTKKPNYDLLPIPAVLGCNEQHDRREQPQVSYCFQIGIVYVAYPKDIVTAIC